MPSIIRFPETVKNTEVEILSLNFPGQEIVHVHGDNPAMGTTRDDFWNVATSMVYLSVGETMNIVSDSANDAAAGTGARTVEVSGLDNDYEPISETITMNGLTDVLTSLSYLRVLDIHTTTVGSTNSNQGIITATASSAATVQASMIVNDNHLLNGRHTIPANKIGIFLGFECDVGKGKELRMIICAGQGHGILETVHSSVLFQNTLFSSSLDVVLDEKTDILFRGSVDAGTIKATCGYNLLIRDKNQTRLP